MHNVMQVVTIQVHVTAAVVVHIGAKLGGGILMVQPSVKICVVVVAALVVVVVARTHATMVLTKELSLYQPVLLQMR